MTAIQDRTIDQTRLEDFATRVAADQSAGDAAVLAYIADRLGLWGSLAVAGPVTAAELAERTGLDERYLTEWLAAMAAARYLEYDAVTDSYSLPAEHALVLADDNSPFAMAGGFEFQAGCWADVDRIADLFVGGGGTAWGDRDERMANGVARFFRPLYSSFLIDEWLPALDGIVHKLESGAHVLDVGCGRGIATSLIARSFPKTSVLGIDLDESSVAVARQSPDAAGLPNLRFETVDAGGDLGGGWDLICMFDAFHHVGTPVNLAEKMHQALASDGTLMLVEPLARDSVADNLEAAGPLYYAPSTIVCVPDALAQRHGIALGAQAGPKRLLGILREAGFGSARVAAETEFNMVIEAKQ